MLSTEYLQERSADFRRLGLDALSLCDFPVTRFPIRMVGEDAKEYIPYVLGRTVREGLQAMFQRLEGAVERFWLREEKVSPHRLPQVPSEIHALFSRLKSIHPILPTSLIHYWCGHPDCASTLIRLAHGLWYQAKLQQERDGAPWLSAVTLLLLARIRRQAAAQRCESEMHADHAYTALMAETYRWAGFRFVQSVGNGAALKDILLIPATPFVFMHRKVEDPLLKDDTRLMRSYGLDPELVDRLRYFENERHGAALLEAVCEDRLGEHLLRRAWARLSLWRLAEQTSDRMLMTWVFDAKRLDRVFTKPEQMFQELEQRLPMTKQDPFIQWLVSSKLAKKEAFKPWLEDRSVIEAFQAYEFDVLIELQRRKGERHWRDQDDQLGKGAEREKAFLHAYRNGNLVLLQPDAQKSLYGGRPLLLGHGVMAVAWADWCARVHRALGKDTDSFLQSTFDPGLRKLIASVPGVTIDALFGGGMIARGRVLDLLSLASRIRTCMQRWHQEIFGMKSHPEVSIGVAADESWYTVGKDNVRIYVSPALAQAMDGALGGASLATWLKSDYQARGMQPVGSVWYGKMGEGSKQTRVLANQGIVLTGAAMAELVRSVRAPHVMDAYLCSAEAIANHIPQVDWPESELRLFRILLRQEGEESVLWLCRLGRFELNGEMTEWFELLDPEGRVSKQIEAMKGNRDVFRKIG